MIEIWTVNVMDGVGFAQDMVTTSRILQNRIHRSLSDWYSLRPSLPLAVLARRWPTKICHQQRVDPVQGRPEAFLLHYIIVTMIRILSWLLMSLLVAPIRGFIGLSHCHARRTSSSHLQATTSRHDLLHSGVSRVFGISSLWFLAPKAQAAPSWLNDESSISSSSSQSSFSSSSSSMTLADAIKTLDMSLPSYGDLKDSKASVMNVESLSVPASKGGGGNLVKPRRSKNQESGDNNGPSPLGNILPSMNKKGPKQRDEYVKLD